MHRIARLRALVLRVQLVSCFTLVEVVVVFHTFHVNQSPVEAIKEETINSLVLGYVPLASSLLSLAKRLVQ